MIQPGTYSNLSNDDYHADKQSISRSGLMDFDKSPYHYWAKHINPDRPVNEPTPAMILGSAAHTLILEPEKWGDFYAVMPEKKLLKDVGREEYDANQDRIEAVKQNLGKKTILSFNDYMTLRGMKAAFEVNLNAVGLLHETEIEKSFFWRCPISGLMLKCRPDFLSRNYIGDLKTCADASPRAFQNAIATGAYHVQGAMIRAAVDQLEGRRIDNVIFIAIETKYPYAMGIYVLDEYALEAGHKKYQELAVSLAQAMIDNRWEDYGTQTISLPKWAVG